MEFKNCLLLECGRVKELMAANRQMYARVDRVGRLLGSAWDSLQPVRRRKQAEPSSVMGLVKQGSYLLHGLENS